MTWKFPEPSATNKTIYKDLVLSTSDLTIIDYSPVYLLIAPNDNELDIVGTKDEDDIAYWANREEVFKDNDTDPENRILIKGEVFKGERLPYRISTSDKIFVFYDGDLFSYETSEEAARHIERTVKDRAADIDEFVAVVGVIMSDWVSKRVREGIEKVAKEWEESREREGAASSS